MVIYFDDSLSKMRVGQLVIYLKKKKFQNGNSNYGQEICCVMRTFIINVFRVCQHHALEV